LSRDRGSGSGDALLRRRPLRTVQATRRGTRLKRTVTIRTGRAVRCPKAVAGRRPRFCSPQGRLTCPSASAKIGTRRSRLTRLTSARLRGRAPGPVSGRLYGKHPVGGPAPTLPLSRCLSATGIRFLGVLFPPRNPAPLTVGSPATPRQRHRTLTGFPRSPRMSYDRVGLPLYPRRRRCSYDHRNVGDRRLPPHNGQPLPPRSYSPTRDVRLTRHQQGFNVVSPFGLPSPVTPGRHRRP
jgi:hypothetical protein